VLCSLSCPLTLFLLLVVLFSTLLFSSLLCSKVSRAGMTAVLLELALMRPILLQSLLQVTACAFLGGRPWMARRPMKDERQLRSPSRFTPRYEIPQSANKLQRSYEKVFHPSWASSVALPTPAAVAAAALARNNVSLHRYIQPLLAHQW